MDGSINQKKRFLKKFLLENNTTLVPEQVVKRFYRNMTIEEATDLLEEMVNTDKRIVKELLQDGTWVYFYKYVPKKAYYY